VSGSPRENPSSKPHRTAKIRPVCRILLPCADGCNGDCLVFAAGLRPDAVTYTFYGHPPSLPGISAQSAVFCGSRQAARDSNSAR
jgi:hypothetical protein